MKALVSAITTSRGVQDANKIIATNANGLIDSSLIGTTTNTTSNVSAISSSHGASDANKIIETNSNGILDLSFIPNVTSSVTSITLSHGSTDANKIVSTNASGVVDPSLVGHATPVALQYASNLIVDASLGLIFRVTLTGNVTIAPPINPTDGQQIQLEITQDSTGSRIASLSSTAFSFSDDYPSSSFALSTRANATDFLNFRYRASTTKWSFLGFIRGF